MSALEELPPAMEPLCRRDETLADVYESMRRQREFLAAIDPDTVSGPKASELLEFFAKLERLGAAGVMVMAPVVDDRMVWRQEGHKNAASYLAEKTGAMPGTALGVLETARQLGDLPETAVCLRRGDFSAAQIKEVAAAATVHPGAEAELLEVAARTGLKGLRTQCQKVKALASWETSEVARYNAIRKSRFFRHSIDADGAVRVEARLTPGDGARLLEAVKAKAAVFFEEGRKAGLCESMSAYAADGLVSLADDAVVGTGTGVARPSVILRVDLAALKRGETEGEEACEIAGVGPVPLATANRVLGDAFVKLVIAEGRDVANVCHLGRSVPAHLATALEERDPTCAVPKCDATARLEMHHRVPFHDGGPTQLSNLVRICTWHHDLLTYEGWTLQGRPGSWSWHPPPDFAGP
jgi:hypothetical protein